jgi:hypothetical protein
MKQILLVCLDVIAFLVCFASIFIFALACAKH